MNGEDLKVIVLSFRFMRIVENSELYLWVSPSATSSILYKRPRCTEDEACRQTWVTGLFQLQHQVPPALFFAPAGKGLGPERGNTSRIQSQVCEVSKKKRGCRETRTVSEPAEKRSCECYVPDPMDIMPHHETWTP
jgi:hypothetical protein